MHFVICVFIAFVCLITAILFTEVFPKWFKAVIALIGSFTSGYAISILIRKIAMWTKAFDKPDLWPVALISAVVVLVIVILVTMFLKKKKSK